jgi:hypothetical protein
MNATDKVIVELSKKSLLNIQSVSISEGINWDEVFFKINEQNIAGIIAEATLSLPSILQPTNIDKWKNTLVQTVYVMSKKNAEFERILKLFNSKNIPVLCLKGIVVKDLYPTPELRTMGDFDILIDKDNRIVAEKIFEENGYDVRKDTLFIEVDKNGIHGEIFFSLEAEFKNEPDYWNERIKENIHLDNNRYLLNPTYEFAYSVIHTAKHLMGSGCGIRNLFDVLMLLQKRDNIDFKLAETICKSQNYEKVLYYMVTAAEHWYGIEIDSSIKRMDIDATEKFLEYLLSYGIFGKSTEGNVLSVQIVKCKDEHIGALRRLFFPPRKMIWDKYQYLKKSALLLPIAWIHRFITAVFIRKYSVKQMLSGIDESVKYLNDRDKWLNELDLK